MQAVNWRGKRDHRKGERRMPYSNVTPEGLRETILNLLRNDDEVKQAILDLIRREGEKHPWRQVGTYRRLPGRARCLTSSAARRRIVG
jgi:hypothetical protein